MNTVLSYLRLPLYATSGLAALGSSLLYFRQNDIIYPANLPAGARTDVPQPKDFQIENAESMYLDTPDGEKLHAYFIRPSNAQLRKHVTILTFHGNAGNIGHRLPISKVLSESLGCNVFMLEYRGYGLSTGAPDENGLTIDGQTALDFVRSHEEMKNTKVVLYGQSLGGAVALKLLASNHKEDIAGVILENTFLSIRKLIPTVMPPARYITMLCHQRWDSEQSMQQVPEDGPPILFLSGLRDEIVPPEMMRTLYDLCKVQQKTWKDFENGDHNSTVAEPGYFNTIWQFLQSQVLAPQDSRKISDADVKQRDLWS